MIYLPLFFLFLFFRRKRFQKQTLMIHILENDLTTYITEKNIILFLNTMFEG